MIFQLEDPSSNSTVHWRQLLVLALVLGQIHLNKQTVRVRIFYGQSVAETYILLTNSLTDHIYFITSQTSLYVFDCCVALDLT